MVKKPATFRPHGRADVAAREYERERGTARERGYDARWEKCSAHHRTLHPLCAYCALAGRVTAATLVDHLYPHKGDARVFWFEPWWVSACASCHSGFKQGVERQGRAAVDALALRLGRPTWAAAGVTQG